MITSKLRFFSLSLIIPALLLGGTQSYEPVGQVSPTAVPFPWSNELQTSPDSPEAPEGEVGDNDVRSSYMGRDIQFDAFNPAIAYNSQNDEYLVVWHADDDDNFLADDENEIYAQRMRASDGSLVGERIAVSHTGTNGYNALDALNPAVAYNSTDNQYLVVWEADLSTGGMVNDEFEIYGQLLAADGSETGTNDFRISYMGGNGDANYDAIRPAVAYDSNKNQYLVVWQGDDNIAPLVNNENEIFGQLLTSAGVATGSLDFRISDMGPDGDTAYNAYNPAVVYNSTVYQYLVVWSGSNDTGGMVAGESEIFAQRLTDLGTSIGTNDFRISDMGGSGNTSFAAYAPDVAYNNYSGEYLIVWYGDDDTGELVNEEFEVYGQLLTSSGGGVGDNDFRISDMGPDGSIAYGAEYPAVTYNRDNNQYLVVWAGIDNIAPLEAGEQEIFSQRLTSGGADTGNNDARISYMGGSGNNPFWAYRPATAYAGEQNQYIVSWYGDHEYVPLIDDEFEIFASRLQNNGTIILSPYQTKRVSYMEPVGDPDYDAADPAVANDPGNSEGTLLIWSGDTNVLSMVEGESEIIGRSYVEFRISTMGTNGDTSRGAYEPAIACNTADHEYLAVWYGDDDTDNEYEIYGQLVTSYGSLIGVNFQISDMGPAGNVAYGAFSPDVVYNSVDNQYLVVWAGDDDSGSLVDNEYEIFGQLLDADGNAVGTNDFRISDMGDTGIAAYGASAPAVTYNPDLNQYLVVWQGDNNTGSLVDNEFEIYGQLLEANGSGAAGTTNDFRISDMGGVGNTYFNAYSPDAAYNGSLDQYLVVWTGDDNIAPLVDDEYEIFGNRLTSTGGGAGANDFRISYTGPSGDEDYDAYGPSVEFSASQNTYLVAWYGDDGPPLANDEYEIYSRFLSASGASLGVDQLRLSDMGPDGDYQYRASNPAILSLPPYFLVVWEGDDNIPPLVNEEFEIFYQGLDMLNRLYLPVVSK